MNAGAQGAALFKVAPTQPWYGWDPDWRRAVEDGLIRRPDLDATVQLHRDWLAYWVTLNVPLYREPQHAVAVFSAEPRQTFGLPPQDFPTVYAGMAGRQPALLPHAFEHVLRDWPVREHRYERGELCLFYPRSPAAQRWTSDKGLVALADMTSRHLWAERMVILGHDWPLSEEPHGFPEDRRRLRRNVA